MVELLRGIIMASLALALAPTNQAEMEVKNTVLIHSKLPQVEKREKFFCWLPMEIQQPAGNHEMLVSLNQNVIVVHIKSI